MQCMPALLGNVGFIMAFKVLVCTTRQGTGRQLQSSCKPRGNPEAEDFLVLLKSCNRMPKLPQLHHALPHSFYGAATLLSLSVLFFPENPTAISCIARAPFSNAFSVPAPLCYPSSDPTFVLFCRLRNSSKPEFKRKPREERLTSAMCFQA